MRGGQLSKAECTESVCVEFQFQRPCRRPQGLCTLFPISPWRARYAIKLQLSRDIHPGKSSLCAGLGVDYWKFHFGFNRHFPRQKNSGTFTGGLI